MKGSIPSGGAIRLFQPVDGVLGIAEGIETALAAHCLTGLPVWATCTADALARVVIPQAVQKVVIFADNDHSGTGKRGCSPSNAAT